MPKNRVRIKFSQTLFFFIFQNLLKRACYYFIMEHISTDVFLISSAFLRQGESCEYEISVRGFITSPKLSQSALKSFLRTSGNIKFSRGRSPEPPLREGEMPPLVLSPYIFYLAWPDHFAKADDGPVISLS